MTALRVALLYAPICKPQLYPYRDALIDIFLKAAVVAGISVMVTMFCCGVYLIVRELVKGAGE